MGVGVVGMASARAPVRCTAGGSSGGGGSAPRRASGVRVGAAWGGVRVRSGAAGLRAPWALGTPALGVSSLRGRVPQRALAQDVDDGCAVDFQELDRTAEAPRGDCSGALVAVEDALVSIGDRDLLQGATWRVMPGTAVGIVGENGAGKSTLMKTLVGLHPVAGGRVRVAPGVRIGYLEQTAVSGSQRTVWEEAMSQMRALNEAKAALEEAESMLEKVPEDPDVVQAYVDAEAAFAAADGYTYEQKVGRVLGGLGFSPEAQRRLCSEFSGGWQMRIALGKLLLSEPELLLLDEPTNHLDRTAREWLGSYLADYGGDQAASKAVVVISHDHSLLNATCSHMCEVRGRNLHLYSGNYDKMLVERELRAAQQQTAYEAQQREIEKLEGFINTFGAKATKAKSAQSKQKALDKILANKVEPPQPLGQAVRRPTLRLPPPPQCPQVTLRATGVACGYDPNSPIVVDADLTLTKGMRLAILGRNGAGKSTFMKALSGRVPALQGSVEPGDERVSLGVFTQDLAQDLPGEAIAVEHVLDVCRAHDSSLTMETGRSMLGSLGLSQEKSVRKIKFLSGGEKARVALAIFGLTPYNCYLLDEASNHLDRPTVEVLSEAFLKISPQCSLAVISHDAEFCEMLKPTHVAYVGGKRLQFHDRPLEADDFGLALAFGEDESSTSAVEGNGAPSGQNGTAVPPKASSPSVADPKKLDAATRKKVLNAPKRIKQIESRLATIDERLPGVEAETAAAWDDSEKVESLSAELHGLQSEQDKLYLEWEELLELVGMQQ